MSLFESDEYQWRETYFVFFDAAQRPAGEDFHALLKELNPRYEVTDLRSDDDGKFESLTLVSPDDYAAMDISCITGDEVREQVVELAEELRSNATSDEMPAIRRVSKCTGRIEVYHFEQLVFVGSATDNDEADDFMDPGSLLVVLEKIAGFCDGIVVDPQTGSLL